MLRSRSNRVAPLDVGQALLVNQRLATSGSLYGSGIPEDAVQEVIVVRQKTDEFVSIVHHDGNQRLSQA